MKKITIYTMGFLIIFILVGCSAQKFVNNYNSLSVSMSGNKPPAFFTIDNLQTMEKYVFETEDVSFSLPSAREEDFTIMGGWYGVSARNGKTISMSLKKQSYGVSVSTSGVYDYTERNKAIDNTTIKYPNKRILKDGEIININVHTEFYGKENYACTVAQSMNPKFKKYKIGYRCYKSNLTKTKVKNVLLLLTYNQPNNLFLSKEYTYEDLQNRAKRVLDSLYIKDSWDD
ncbi:hypothetical protein [Sulfurimonas sp.]|uniref:hypothetical protein n=1 Tax=Sulfurimonas sp. TaxID=2022749 RepID=UPI00356996C1